MTEMMEVMACLSKFGGDQVLTDDCFSYHKHNTELVIMFLTQRVWITCIVRGLSGI